MGFLNATKRLAPWARRMSICWPQLALLALYVLLALLAGGSAAWTVIGLLTALILAAAALAGRRGRLGASARIALVACLALGSMDLAGALGLAAGAVAGMLTSWIISVSAVVGVAVAYARWLDERVVPACIIRGA